jgi:polar amino acid transport system substrate-binding protein
MRGTKSTLKVMPAMINHLTFLLILFLSLNSYGKGIVVGMELSYPPFEMTDKEGRPTGVSVDLAHALSAFLKEEVRIENISFDGLIPALKTKKIDLIISSMTATPERSKSVAFSHPYLKTGLAILLGKTSKANSVQDLDGNAYKVTVKKGSTGHLYAINHLKKAKLLVLDKESSCVLEVTQGKADAFIYDSMSIYQHSKKHPTQTRAILKPFKEESWAIAVRKNDVKLLEQVNLFLKKYKEEGGLDKLGDKYFSEQKKEFKNLNIPFYF